MQISLELKLPVIALHKNYLYCGEDDGMMKIYDLDAKYWIRGVKYHKSGIRMICVSNNGSFICSSSLDCLVIWRDVLAAPKKLFIGEINCLCISWDNKWLITAEKNSHLVKWSLETGEQLGSLENSIMIICLKVTTRNILYAAGVDNIIYVSDLNSMTDIKTLEGHTKKINWLQLTNNEKKLLSGSNDGTIRIWDTKNNIEIEKIDTGLSEVLMIEISPNDQFFASANEWIKIWSFKDLTKPSFEKNSSTSVKYLKISVDARFLIVGFYKEIEIYNLNKHYDRVEAFYSGGEITGVYESVDSSCLIISTPIRVEVHNIERGGLNSQSEIFNIHAVSNMKLTRNSKYVFAAIDKEYSIACWDLEMMKKIQTLADPALKSECLEITRDDQFLISCSRDNSLIVWDISNIPSIKPVADLQAHEDSLCFFYATEDSKFLLSSSSNGATIVWEIGSWNQVAMFESRPIANSIAETSNLIICPDINNQISFWSKASWKPLHVALGWKDLTIDHLKLCKKKNILIVASVRVIILFDLSKFVDISTLDLSETWCQYLQITQNEDFLVFFGYDDKIIQIWNIDQHCQVASLQNSSFVKTFEMVYNDKFIVACLHSGELVLWNFEDWNIVGVFGYYILNLKKFSKDDCMIITESHDRVVSLYSVKKLISHESQWRSLSMHTDNLYETYTSQKINCFANPNFHKYIQKFSEITIFPLRINCLHYYCWKDDVDALKKALDSNPPIIRDLNHSTPLSYAIKKNAQRCIIEILSYISKIENNFLRNVYFHAIRDDILDLFRVQVNILPFLSYFLVKDEYKLVKFPVSRSQFPITIISPTSILNTKKFDRDAMKWWKIFVCQSKSESEKLKPIQYWTSPFSWNFSIGSSDSLKLLKAIKDREELELYQIEFIKSLIRMKWDSLWKWIFCLSIIFWANVVFMVFAIFTHEIVYLWFFFLLNLPLFYIEFFSFWSDRKGYFLSIWNYLDIIRFIICFWWWALEINEENSYPINYFAAATNFLTGLIYFRAFDRTRFYVRLILRAFYESLFFLVILIYSILAFSIIYATTDDTADILSVWKQTYELEAGNFDSSGYSFLQYLYFTLAILINVIVLLNLLVSVLGDSFSKLKEEEQEVDLKEKLNTIIEMETALFWKKLWTWLRKRQFISYIFGIKYFENMKKREYLQVCDYFQENAAKTMDDDIKELRSEFQELNKKMNLIQELSIKMNEMNEINKKMNKIQELTRKMDEMNERNNKMESKIDKIFSKLYPGE